ncbi:acyl carrier protein [Polaribacter uvawellassae]|uniref:acyl carrier protein n=1 Tax=Polaribacter uvawellassae TaxID=3133495 RepID=UPI0032199D0F
MDKVNEILAEVLKIDLKQTTENLTMDDVDNWDSLTHMSLIVDIESNLDIELSGDDIAEMTTFDAIRKIVSKYL